MGNQAILANYPLHLTLGGEDVTFLVDQGLTWSSVDPGGFETMSIPIPKDMPTTLAGLPVRLDCGLGVAWEGRVAETQRSLGHRTTITCEGYGSVLKEQLLSMVYVDRDLTRWQAPTIARQIALVTNNYQQGSAQLGADPSSGTPNPALVQMITDSWVSPYMPAVESWYDAGAQNLIGVIHYAYSSNSLYAASITNSNDGVTLADQLTSVSSSGYWVPAHQYRYMLLSFFDNTTPGGAQGQQSNAYWQQMAVYGNHGLPGRGSDPVGFYTSDIARHALTQQSTIQAGIIPDATSFIVPHYAQYQPVPIEQVMSDMAALSGQHWGTWESLAPLTGNAAPRFDFRPYPSSATAWCQRQDCDTLDINEQLAGLYDSVQVSYTDAAGVQQAALAFLDNPYLDAVGMHRALQINMGTSTPAAAATYGQMILALSQQQARAAGRAVMPGMVNTPSGHMPAFLLRAGLDRLRVVDLPGQNAWGTTNDFAVSRVEASVTTDGISTSVELGVGANLTEVLTARMQAATALAAVA